MVFSSFKLKISINFQVFLYSNLQKDSVKSRVGIKKLEIIFEVLLNIIYKLPYSLVIKLE